MAGCRGRYKVEGGMSIGWLEHGLGSGVREGLGIFHMELQSSNFYTYI